MKRFIFFVLVVVAFSGCVTVHRANNYGEVKIEYGEKPIETVEVENSSWLLLRFIPLAGGDWTNPDGDDCIWFTNTATLENNLNILEWEMKRVNAKRMANVISRRNDESVFLILLTRRSYHTSAVLLGSEEKEVVNP